MHPALHPNSCLQITDLDLELLAAILRRLPTHHIRVARAACRALDAAARLKINSRAALTPNGPLALAAAPDWARWPCVTGLKLEHFDPGDARSQQALAWCTLQRFPGADAQGLVAPTALLAVKELHLRHSPLFAEHTHSLWGLLACLPSLTRLVFDGRFHSGNDSSTPSGSSACEQKLEQWLHAVAGNAPQLEALELPRADFSRLHSAVVAARLPSLAHLHVNSWDEDGDSGDVAAGGSVYLGPGGQPWLPAAPLTDRLTALLMQSNSCVAVDMGTAAGACFPALVRMQVDHLDGSGALWLAHNVPNLRDLAVCTTVDDHWDQFHARTAVGATAASQLAGITRFRSACMQGFGGRPIGAAFPNLVHLQAGLQLPLGAPNALAGLTRLTHMELYSDRWLPAVWEAARAAPGLVHLGCSFEPATVDMLHFLPTPLVALKLQCVGTTDTAVPAGSAYVAAMCKVLPRFPRMRTFVYDPGPLHDIHEDLVRMHAYIQYYAPRALELAAFGRRNLLNGFEMQHLLRLPQPVAHDVFWVKLYPDFDASELKRHYPPPPESYEQNPDRYCLTRLQNVPKTPLCLAVMPAVGGVRCSPPVDDLFPNLWGLYLWGN